MDIDAPAPALKEMERQMGLSEDVIRFMSIKVDKHEEGPSAMMQRREERSDRDRGFGDRDRGPRRDFGDRDRGPRRDFGDREGGERGPRRPREEGAAE